MSDIDLSKVQETLTEAESKVKAVWEIDGVTVYVKDIHINNGKADVEWFTFDTKTDLTSLGSKVEDLAKQLICKTRKSKLSIFEIIGNILK